MVSAIVVFVVVAFFILALHLYIRLLWPAQRGRHRLPFTIGAETTTTTGQDPSTTGLDKSIINSLPTFVFGSTNEKSEEEKEAMLECSVCLSEFQENEKCRLLPNCKHRFHTDCIDMWFFSHSTCPLCRAMVVSPTLAPLQQQQGQVHIELDAIQAQNASSLNDLSSALSSPREYSSTRSSPHLAIHIPRRRWDSNFTSPRCLSLSLPSCSSPLDQGCSSPTAPAVKSPSTGLGMSFKRLLSKGKRVPPSDQETGEIDHDGAGSSVCS